LVLLFDLHINYPKPSAAKASATVGARAGAPLKPVHHLVLLLLAKKPTYGIDLLVQLDEYSQGSVHLNAGSLYRLIGQMLDSGLLEGVEGEATPAQPGAPRKCYGVTASGREALAAEARRQAHLVEMARSLDLIEGG